MHDPFSVLMDEHRVIEKVLGAFEAAADKDLGASFYERAVDFITNYADANHHGKEEERLFPRMVERGMPAQHGPIGVMLEEHKIGRAHVANMRAGLGANDLDAVKRESLAFAALLRDHIAKEDQVLFQMGRQFLNDEDKAALMEQFAEVSPPTGTAASYEQLAADLAAEAGAGA